MLDRSEVSGTRPTFGAGLSTQVRLELSALPSFASLALSADFLTPIFDPTFGNPADAREGAGWTDGSHRYRSPESAGWNRKHFGAGGVNPGEQHSSSVDSRDSTRGWGYESNVLGRDSQHRYTHGDLSHGSIGIEKRKRGWAWSMVGGGSWHSSASTGWLGADYVDASGEVLAADTVGLRLGWVNGSHVRVRVDGLGPGGLGGSEWLYVRVRAGNAAGWGPAAALSLNGTGPTAVLLSGEWYMARIEQGIYRGAAPAPTSGTDSSVVWGQLRR